MSAMLDFLKSKIPTSNNTCLKPQNPNTSSPSDTFFDCKHHWPWLSNHCLSLLLTRGHHCWSHVHTSLVSLLSSLFSLWGTQGWDSLHHTFVGNRHRHNWWWILVPSPWTPQKLVFSATNFDFEKVVEVGFDFWISLKWWVWIIGEIWSYGGCLVFGFHLWEVIWFESWPQMTVVVTGKRWI